MADTATFSAALKTKFLGPIRDQVGRNKVLLYGGSDDNPTDFKGITRSAEGIDFVGNEFRIPIKAKFNQSVGFRHENESLPSPGSTAYTYLSEPMRHAYGAMTITGQLLKASTGTEAAFRPALKAEMKDLTESLKVDHNRAAWGDGSGKLASVATNATSGDTTVSLDTTVNFRGGEIIDFTTSSGTAVSAAHEVIGVDRLNKAITIAPALGANVTSGTHFPVRASANSTTSAPNNSLNREIQGLSSIVSDTGTLHGISPTAYPFWRSYVKTSAGTPNETLFRTALDNVGFESGIDLESGNDFVWITTRGVRRRYQDTLVAFRRFTEANGKKLTGGFSVLEFDGQPIFADDQCPSGNIFGLSIPELFWSQMSDWEWMDQDGDVLKQLPNKDAYTAILFKYSQLGTTRRNAHLRLTGVTDDPR